MPVNVKCDMRKDCPNPVTHIGEKGYAYCTACAPKRRGVERVRKMRDWEVDMLREGKPLPSFEPITQEQARAYEHRRKLCAGTLTLDGEPAEVYGFLRDRATVAHVGGGGAITLSWDDVETVIANGGAFKS